MIVLGPGGLASGIETCALMLLFYVSIVMGEGTYSNIVPFLEKLYEHIESQCVRILSSPIFHVIKDVFICIVCCEQLKSRREHT